MHICLRRFAAAACAPVLVSFAGFPAARAASVGVAEELERLSQAHGFKIKGIDQVQQAVGRAEGDDLYPRLRRLLTDFDHVIVQAPEGGVEKVIILGAKVPYEPPPAPPAPAGDRDEEAAKGEEAAEDGEEGEIVLETQRRGTQHSVKVGLEGSGGRVEQTLLVDTGADNLVLPVSSLSRLGLAPNSLNEREMQTANGKVTARFGKIQALWLGETRIADVDVAFVEDNKLGNGGLLGMSVLGRYKMTIDDESNRLILRRP